MQSLIELKDGLPIYSDYAITIREFKEIVLKDKRSKGDSDGREKKMATKLLAFVYFMCDYKSPYNTYSEIEKLTKIKRDLEIPPDFVIPKYVYDACDKYKELSLTVSMVMLEGAIFAAKATAEYLKNVDYKDRTEKGAMVYEPVDVAKIIANIGGALTGLEALEERVKKEKEVNKAKVRKGGDVGNREDA